MMLAVASFTKRAGADRLASFLLVEYGTSITVEVRLDITAGRWLVYVDSSHVDWDTIRVLSYGFMSGANQ